MIAVQVERRVMNLLFITALLTGDMVVFYLQRQTPKRRMHFRDILRIMVPSPFITQHGLCPGNLLPLQPSCVRKICHPLVTAACG